MLTSDSSKEYVPTHLWCYYSPYFTQKELKHREVKLLAQGHTATEWLSLDSNSRRLAPEAKPLTTALNCFKFPVLCILAFSEAPGFCQLL